MFNEEKGQLHIVMFPWLAFGHIGPFVQLSNKLSSHGVKISFFTTSANVDRLKTMLIPSPTTTRIIPLSLPTVDGLPAGAESTNETSSDAAELLKLAVDLLQPQVKTLLSELKPHLVFFDFALGWIPSMCLELGIKTVFYSVFTVLGIALVPALKSQAKHPTIEEIMNPPPPLHSLPLRTFEAHDFSYMFKSFNGGPCAADRIEACLHGCIATLFKSCREMEAPYVDYLSAKLGKPVLLAGPIFPETQSEAVLEEKWATWLGQFSPKSVIYCSFGSESFLTDEQIKQLALGLELTGFPFILVLNFPASLDSSAELRRALPEGFLERVKDRGIVHSGWVQQRQILAHGSIGCHIGHAGFSSVVEALVNDCQLVLLPVKGDGFIVAKQVAFEWKAGVAVNRKDEDGYFGKDDVREAVRKVMSEVDKEPAKSIRENHKKWRDFVLNNEIRSKFVEDLVEEMKVLTEAF